MTENKPLASTDTRAHQQPGFENADLLIERAYIDGRWIDADDKIKVSDPATGRLVGEVPSLNTGAVRRAVGAAAIAQKNWAALLPQDRQQALMRWHEQILRHKEDLATIMTLEQGKPLGDARAEIDYGASFIEWFAAEAVRTNGETMPSHIPGRELLTVREPLGVVGLVTPWNFPNAMLTRKAGAALAAGCAVIAHPSSETPFSALALAELASRSGLPSGLFNVVTGSGQKIVAELCVNKTVRGISFTGSTEVGSAILKQSAETVQKCCMELGGHAPFVGFGDAPVDTLVEAALKAKFETSGQDCLAANRILIHESIYEAFLARFTEATKSLVVGNGFEAGVQIGPLQNDKQVAKSKEHSDDAAEHGARLLCGGQQHNLGGLFFEPTVIADVTTDMKIWREETFGPVAAVCSFSSEEEVVAAANDTDYGLAAYVYSNDLGTTLRMSRALEYGMVAVNSVKLTGPPIPFGGVKQSGLGREGSVHGTDEFTELKYICLNTGSDASRKVI
ncbi:MAG: NAD-dependent succinate-semialdehyde dehydrogenase [Gammaproteobacteria bacterium]|nr:NAD-dependent succinate-semialdehyde dehydrogenase [Gammaproteobacteria bacterium]